MRWEWSRHARNPQIFVTTNICDRVISHIDCMRIIIRARYAHVELTVVLRAACGSCHAAQTLLAFCRAAYVADRTETRQV
jgi:hypothetical protein